MTDRRNAMHSESEPFIPYASREGLPAGLAEALDAYEQRMGFMPNALKLYMHRPELLECLVRLNNTVMRDASSHLDAGLKRRISAVCSLVNKSAYCVAHTTATLLGESGTGSEGWDFDDGGVRALLDPEYRPDEPAEAACFAYARAATADPSEVPREILDDLAAHLSPPAIVELACLVGFWRMYNSVHEAMHIPLEEALLDDVEPSPPAGRVTAKVEIFSSARCPFCTRAKRLLKAKGADFEERVIDDAPAVFDEMRRRSHGRSTVPQVFIDDAPVGGLDELITLQRTGELDALLGIER